MRNFAVGALSLVVCELGELHTSYLPTVTQLQPVCASACPSRLSHDAVTHA